MRRDAIPDAVTGVILDGRTSASTSPGQVLTVLTAAVESSRRVCPAWPLNRDRWLRKPVAGASPPAFGVISRECYRTASERMITGGGEGELCKAGSDMSVFLTGAYNCTDEGARFTRVSTRDGNETRMSERSPSIH